MCARWCRPFLLDLLRFPRVLVGVQLLILLMKCFRIQPSVPRSPDLLCGITTTTTTTIHHTIQLTTKPNVGTCRWRRYILENGGGVVVPSPTGHYGNERPHPHTVLCFSLTSGSWENEQHMGYVCIFVCLPLSSRRTKLKSKSTKSKSLEMALMMWQVLVLHTLFTFPQSSSMCIHDVI